jgi:putative heme-binding domain-containing protein
MNRPLLLLILIVAGGFLPSHAESLGRIEKPLTLVNNPPPVQMLVPGFTVRELPLELHNINNLVYAPDGRLFALCYDGNILQLKDTDGDGLEDASTLFFDNKDNDIPPSIGMTWGPGGLYLASQGRVIRLRDLGDGRCKLETVTAGWAAPAGKAGSNLDAVGIAVDKRGNIFFGLGCDDWRDAYRVNKKTGKSDYNLHSERGTIQKLSPDWTKRETICTGVRFTVALGFNSAGDLFCTDQEGATWLPNGNPFDELLHIQPGRHYGFPPRHPRHLPEVIDEPSLFDYAPQHQATCGLHFNEPMARTGKSFGPAWWRGDAIVAGESRGKIWRTKLVKTAAGYVARTDLIACLQMLTIDAVPTPRGDLLVTCHSGKPDWGTGPQGIGKVFKISYVDNSTPQPVLAYAASPTETRVIFDHPFDAVSLPNLASETTISMGRYVTAGERFESFRPGYQAVKIQRTMPRFELPVVSARVQPEEHSMVVETVPRTEAVNYAVTLPMGQRSVKNSGSEQPSKMDLLTDLTGVETTWRDAGGKKNWEGWLPHLDFEAARAFTAASREHQQLFKALRKSGTLTMRCQLDLWQMLHPATQPGSKLDFECPSETVTVLLKAGSKLDVRTDAKIDRVNDHEVRLVVSPSENLWLPLELTLSCPGRGEPSLEVSWFTAEDLRPRALPLRRILLPWAKPNVAAAIANRVPEIEGGDWERGKKVFFGELAACSKCHQVGGEGETIGPDLSNLIYRDYASVFKDIVEPSSAINPDHLAYVLELKDGNVETGVLLHNNHDQIVLGQSNGQHLTIPKTNVSAMKPSAVSLMPEGLLKALDPQQQKDLFTFLLAPRPKTPKN